jgi:hypothetical protein
MPSPKTVRDAATAESPKKKPRRAIASASAKKPAARAASPRAPRKATAQAAAVPQMPDQGTIDRMVAEAAYYLAERRAFAPGYEDQDWQAAREQIEAELRAARNPLG